MKIWIDARICEQNTAYSQFVETFISALSKQESEHEYIVYCHKIPEHAVNTPKIRYIQISFKTQNFFDTKKARALFENEKFWLMIFFDIHIPYGLKTEYFVILESLKEVFFPKKKYISRKIYQLQLSKAIEKASKVLVLDHSSSVELNERLDVPEEKIGVIPGFFPSISRVSASLIQTDIAQYHNLRGPYIIYDSGNELHNNFDRILKAIKIIKDEGSTLNLIILCDETSRDLDIRSRALEYGIASQILFLGPIPPAQEMQYYIQSSGVIFASIYESFPFSFSKALAYNCPIFANDIASIHQVMWNSIHYLDPLATHTMVETLMRSISKAEKSEYHEVLEIYTAQNSAQKLLTHIHQFSQSS